QAAAEGDWRKADNSSVRLNPAYEHGRIYRISNKQQRRLPPFHLDPPVTADLVGALRHPNIWVRMTAQRLLCERNDPAAVPALSEMLTNRLVHARLHALWT